MIQQRRDRILSYPTAVINLTVMLSSIKRNPIRMRDTSTNIKKEEVVAGLPVDIIL